ncbi:MAG: hypothetical protein HKN85_04915 [Gammaproteobacteria bacterium]|nr:hypothetical protein [Gammaproteobacteria bacterium]
MNNNDTNRSPSESDTDQQPGYKLAELNWDLQPARDLWPDISSRIRFADRQLKPSAKIKKASWQPFALAASVVFATVSLVFSSMTWQKAQDADKYQAALAVYHAAQIQLIDQQHQMVRAQFSQLLQRDRENLDPAFVTELETLMTNVDLASAEIKKALAAQPNDPDYASMLVRTYQQEVKMLNKVKLNRIMPEPATTQEGYSI